VAHMELRLMPLPASLSKHRANAPGLFGSSYSSAAVSWNVILAVV
jgi:hypothetical protein